MAGDHVLTGAPSGEIAGKTTHTKSQCTVSYKLALRWWPPERDERMIALWRTGMSASRAGMELGCSRNSIIGRLRRLGLTNADRGGKPKAEQGLRRGPKRIAKPPVAKPMPAPKSKPLPAIAAAPVVIDLTGRPTIASVTPGRCRYPLDELPSADMRVCGAVTVAGTSWCANCLTVVRGIPRISHRAKEVIIYDAH